MPRSPGTATCWGLPHLYTFGDLAFFDAGGTRLFLSAIDEAPGRRASPSCTSGSTTSMRRANTSPRAGVVFTDPPHLIHRHESGMEEWMAFFTDPDGHTLALMSQVTPAQH